MCVFCKIINKEIPAYTLYENDYVIFTSSSGRSLEGCGRNNESGSKSF